MFVPPFGAQGPEGFQTFWDELQKGSATVTISTKQSENSKEFVLDRMDILWVKILMNGGFEQ